MAENETTVTPTPQDAFKNLVKSVKTPLVWFGIGFISAVLWQGRRKKVIQG